MEIVTLICAAIVISPELCTRDNATDLMVARIDGVNPVACGLQAQAELAQMQLLHPNDIVRVLCGAKR